MNKYRRDIILLIKEENLNETPIENTVENINYIIGSLENNEVFCKTHELLDRNKITGKKQKILKFINTETDKPFRFLINKN